MERLKELISWIESKAGTISLADAYDKAKELESQQPTQTPDHRMKRAITPKRMSSKEVLRRIKLYFGIHELVPNKVISKYGADTCWQFLDIDALHSLLVVREGLGLGITINTQGSQQKGLRHNRSAMVAKKTGIYLSAHMMGKAFDFKVTGMKPEDVRNWIIENANLFRCKIRLEHKLNGKLISWVHLDTFYLECNPKVYLFDV